MKKPYWKLFLLLLFLPFFGCPAPTTGSLSGIITDLLTSSPIEGVKVTIFDANTNAPTGSTVFTNAKGEYEQELDPGTYFVKLSMQGYDDLPGKNTAPLPLNVTVGETIDYSAQMTQSSVTNSGYISGTVEAVSGEFDSSVLVVASDGSSGYSSVTDANREYTIYNVPAGSYMVKGWVSGFNSDEQDITVSADTETSDVGLLLTEGAAGSVTGQVTFLATNNAQVDVSMVHPQTKETIPGLTTDTDNATSSYTINNVPDGTYLARATYENDTYVMDPDWIVKNGEPSVTVSGGVVTRNFSVTGAVTLSDPTNPDDDTQPLEITDTVPAFSWIPYSSTSDYVIEVINSNGLVIWGGFSGNYAAKNISIPKATTSVDYDYDGSATAQFEIGKIYRWRIYASKDDAKESAGWKLISVSEDQKGIIKIVE